MISQEITLDKLLGDIDQQIEILQAISQDSHILVEQLRLLYEAREQIIQQELEIQRLQELVDPDEPMDHASQIDRQIEKEETGVLFEGEKRLFDS